MEGGSHLYNYPVNPNQFVDPTGLWGYYSGLSWANYMKEERNNVAGDMSACSYYESMISIAPSCTYYKEALKICKGKYASVNILTKVNLAISDLFGDKSLNENEVFTNIRKKLAENDQRARDEGKIDKNGCVFGDEIDAYHEKVFEEVGLFPQLYGGNLLCQNCIINPVPVDPSSWRY